MKWTLIWLGIAVLVQTFAASLDAEPLLSSEHRQEALPTATDLDAARARIREARGAQLASEDRAEAAKAASELLEAADNEANAPADRYVMLDEALATFQRVRDVPRVVETIVLFEEQFDMDGVALRLKAGEALKEGPNPAAPDAVADLFLDAGYLALSRRSFDDALAARKEAYSMRGKASSKEERERITDRCADLKRAIKDYENLLKRADTKPEDRERRDKLGLFQCTTLGLWSEGLATLEGCEDADLRAAVEAELAYPETPKECYSVGGLWWNLAEGWKGTPDERAAMRARACYWYRLAQAGFDATTTEGLLIESRLAEASALDQPPPPATPTSAPKARTAKGVSQKATVYRGEWSIENAAIVGVDPDTESSDPSCMAFGDPSWSEFDLTFQMQVSRVKQDHPGGAGVRFHYQSKKDLYQVALGPRHPRVIRWLKGAWKDWAKVKPKIGYDGWNTVHLEVRGTEARCLVDGQQVAQFGDMELTNGQLGFQAQDVKLVIKDIQVTDPAGNVLWAGLPKFEK